EEGMGRGVGRDGALLMAGGPGLLGGGLVRPGRLADLTDGIDEVRSRCRGFAPEAVADTCAIPADTIRRLAHELAAAPRAAVYGRIGTCNQEFGTLASWLREGRDPLAADLRPARRAIVSNPLA